MYSVTIVWAPLKSDTKEITSIQTDLKSTHTFIEGFRKEIELASGTFYGSIIEDYKPGILKNSKTVEDNVRFN
jgi:hypothetical protein